MAGRQHEDGSGVAGATDAPTNLEAVHVRHGHVQDDEISRPPGQHLQRLGTVAGATRLVALVTERPLQGVADGGVVLGHEDAGTGHGCCDRTGGGTARRSGALDS